MYIKCKFSQQYAAVITRQVADLRKKKITITHNIQRPFLFNNFATQNCYNYKHTNNFERNK